VCLIARDIETSNPDDLGPSGVVAPQHKKLYLNHINFVIKESFNKTVPEKVATTRTEDGHKKNTKTSTEI
jgi:hypothetical protein